MGTTFGRAHGGWKVCAAHALALVAGELPALAERTDGYSIHVDALAPHRSEQCQMKVEVP